MARWMTFSLLMAIFASTLGCGTDQTPVSPDNQFAEGDTVLFEVDQQGERFFLAVSNEEVVTILDDLRKSGEPAPVITGELRAGDGGFNTPYDWHLDPETVEVVEVAMEVCDGRPSFVQEDLEYWLETVGRYCPWGPVVVARK